jgi:[methyl-Co(III) methanol-specific corrinoid protein]:coenzyme M methyltransferase
MSKSEPSHAAGANIFGSSKVADRKRVTSYLNGDVVDVAPCFSGMGMMAADSIRSLQVHFSRVHRSAELMARSALATVEIFDFDAAVLPYDVCTLAEALGRKVDFYENSDDVIFPSVISKWSDPDEVEVPRNLFERGRLPLLDEALRTLIACSADRFAVGTWVFGPFTLAGQVYEPGLLLRAVVKDRARVEQMLDRLTDLTIESALHYQSLGVDYLTVREMGSCSDLVSPRIWKTLILPRLQRVFAAIEIPKILHICGSTNMIISMMNECGADCLSVDQKNDIARSRRELGSEPVIFGNFDPYRTLVQMERGEVADVIRKCIEDGVDAVWPGCDLWPAAKGDNVREYVRTVRKYGAVSTSRSCH